MNPLDEQQYFNGFAPRAKKRAVRVPKKRGENVVYDVILEEWCGSTATRTQKREAAMIADELCVAFGTEVTPLEYSKRWTRLLKDYPNSTPWAMLRWWQYYADKKRRVDPEEEAKRQAFLKDVRERNSFIGGLSDAEFEQRAKKVIAWLDQKRKTGRGQEVRYFPSAFALREIRRDNQELVQVIWWAEQERRRQAVKDESELER